MKNFILLSFILLISISGKETYCQKVFREGYVIKKTGESLYGLVEYSSNQNIPSKCAFKRFDIARKVEYTPDEILAFGYKNGNRYESRELNNKKSFYEVLVTGRIILYSKGSGFYIDKDHLGLAELKSGRVSYPNGQTSTWFESLPDFLSFITDGKPGYIADKFNLKNEIVPLITRYDKEAGENFYVFNRSISEKQLSQKVLETGVSKNRFGLMLGMNLYMLNLKPDPRNSNYLPDPGKVSAMTFGLTYERLLSRKTDRLSMKIEVLYNKQSFYAYEQHNNSNNVLITRNDAIFDFTGIKVPVLFQYSFTGGKIVPFVNGGIAYQRFTEKSFLQVSEVENTTSHEVRTYLFKTFAVPDGEISAIAGLGLRTRIFNNISLFVQGRIEVGQGALQKSNDYSTSSEKPFKHNSIQSTLLLGIAF